MTTLTTLPDLKEKEGATLLPTYNRALLKEKIVHIGLGAFHRGHQAFVLEKLLRQEQRSDWGICAVSLFGGSAKMIDQLEAQACLYTVLERENEQVNATVVGAIINTIQRQKEGIEAVLNKLLEPQVEIITLTVTEKGYCLAPGGDQLDLSHKDIRHDLENLENPRTVPAILFLALRARYSAGLPPLTLISCDNIPENSLLLKNAIRGFAEAVDPEFVHYLETQIAFPCSMVDRIVPATTPALETWIGEHLGVVDHCAIETEPFLQWVIEDHFAGERPHWEKIPGVSIVKDVRPFEEMKLRMLNGSHSFMAYLGSLANYKTVAECIADPIFHQAVLTLMLSEQKATLSMQEIDLEQYAQELIQRFKNSALHHQLAQIAMDGSQKIPQRFLEPLLWREAKELDSPLLILGIAGWLYFVIRNIEQLADPYQERFAQIIKDAEKDNAAVEAILKSGIFPQNFTENSNLKEKILSAYRSIDAIGAKAALQQIFTDAYSLEA